MTLAGIHEGDVVFCDVKGRRFYAVVQGRGKGELRVSPITPHISYRTVTARQVIEHFRKARRTVRA